MRRIADDEDENAGVLPASHSIVEQPSSPNVGCVIAAALLNLIIGDFDAAEPQAPPSLVTADVSGGAAAAAAEAATPAVTLAVTPAAAAAGPPPHPTTNAVTVSPAFTSMGSAAAATQELAPAGGALASAAPAEAAAAPPVVPAQIHTLAAPATAAVTAAGNNKLVLRAVDQPVYKASVSFKPPVSIKDVCIA